MSARSNLRSPFEEALPRDYTRNSRAIGASSALFMTAMSLVSSTTVLPAYLAQIGTSDVMIGLASGLGSGGWLLPQLLVAGLAARMVRKKPLMVWPAFIGRPILLVIGLFIWLFSVNLPDLARAAVLIGWFTFFLSDGIGSVPWFDILAKTIPARRRGRVMGTGQVVGGVGGILSGVVVGYVLSQNSPWVFPANYALLYALASIVLLCGAVSLSLVHEPESKPETQEVLSTGAIFKMMPRLLLHDRPFSTLIVVRMLSGFVLVASSFYVLHATKNLGLSTQVTGLFVSAQVMGNLVAGLMMGTVQDRWGPLVHIRLVLLISAISPFIALAVNPLISLLGPTILYPYLALYLFLGISMGAMGWPYFNWIMEYTDDRWRPVYIGMSNTLGAVTMFAPALGGWIAGLASYEATFVASLIFAVAGLLLSLTLPNTRRGRRAENGSL